MAMEPICPSRFKAVAHLLWCNGLPQMQFMEDTCQFVACFCNAATDEFCNKIKAESGCQSLCAEEYIGHEYFSIAWYDYAKLQNVYDALVRNNVAFRVTYNGYWGYWPHENVYCPRLPCTRENMEKQAVMRITKDLDGSDSLRRCVLQALSWPHFGPWNWVTEQGRELCARLCRENGVELKPMDHRDNFYLLPVYVPLESLLPIRMIEERGLLTPRTSLAEIAAVHTSVPPAVLSQEEENVGHADICQVCMMKPPDTVVMPCGHCVVCEECSKKLAQGDTPSKTKCIMCRGEIEGIYIVSKDKMQ